MECERHLETILGFQRGNQAILFLGALDEPSIEVKDVALDTPSWRLLKPALVSFTADKFSL